MQFRRVLPLALVAAVIALAGASTACDRTITTPGTVDTVLVERLDTLRLTTVDTIEHFDTVTQTVQVPGPPVHDSVIVVRVDTLLRVDTLTQIVTVPGAAVHDTTWIYVQVNPTNPLAGGDTLAGVAYIPIYEGYAIVFWHGHFVGVVHEGTGYWRSYLYLPGQLEMPTRGDFPSLEAAVRSLVPIVLTLQPVRVEPSAALLRAVRVPRGR